MELGAGRAAPSWQPGQYARVDEINSTVSPKVNTGVSGCSGLVGEHQRESGQDWLRQLGYKRRRFALFGWAVKLGIRMMIGFMLLPCAAADLILTFKFIYGIMLRIL